MSSIETICTSDATYYCDSRCDCADCLDENPDFCSNLPPTTPTPKCADATFEHSIVNCDPASFCRLSVCHSVKNTCFRSESCCDCFHGTAFNGTACVSTNDQCSCMDELGVIHESGTTWVDSEDAACIQHTCASNTIVTLNKGIDCPIITGCAKGQIGPLRLPGQCCVTCISELLSTTTGIPTGTTIATPQPTTAATLPPACASDATCHCVEDCANPEKCVDTVLCCESYECQASYERLAGRCILRANCAVGTTTAFTPKCTYPILGQKQLVESISASSFYTTEDGLAYSPTEVVMGGLGWVVDPDRDSSRELTIKFTQPIEVTGLSVLQKDVEAFTVFFSEDGTNFTPYSDPGDVFTDPSTGLPVKTFQGSKFPENEFDTAYFIPSTTVSYIRIKINAVDVSPGLNLIFPRINLEVLGCHEDTPGDVSYYFLF